MVVAAAAVMMVAAVATGGIACARWFLCCRLEERVSPSGSRSRR